MAFDALLKKYFLVVLLGLIALSAYFEAKGATQLFGAALLVPASSAAPSPGAALAPPLQIPQREPRTAEPLIERNPFDSVTGSLHPKPEAELIPKPVEPDMTDPLSATACDGITAFIITESTDRNWSVAALQGSGEPHPRMRRVGDDVGGKQVAFIGFNPKENSPSVWLTSADKLCQVLLFRTAPPPVAAAPAPAPTPEAPAAPPRAGPSPVPPDIASKIQKVSETEFNVDRSVVDKILENQAELMRSARIVPEQKDGKVVGIRLFGVRPDTLLGTLGLQNGDRLEAINNFNMGSPEKALEAYATLRTASRLDVKVNRRGSPINIGFSIK
ncbi:MAG TPA: type II secretion system protein GspC [Polyangiaceae bacterium]|nr:type II secretion system protein GspC [Polyangiaceae bacterium]